MNRLLLYLFIHISAIGATQNNTLCYEISHPSKSKHNSYLFGTMHVMDADHFFFPKKITKLLKKTEVLCIEIKDLGNKSLDANQLFDSNKLLNENCSSSQWDRLTTWAEKTLLMNAEQFEANFNHAKPFLVLQFIMSASLPAVHKSHEIELEKLAHLNEIQVLQIESVEAQLQLFDAIPYKGQMDMIFNELKNNKTGKEDFEKMQNTYSKQSLDSLCLLTDDKLFEAYRDVFLDDRNMKWIPKMETMMKDQKVFFAFGAAHLCGSNGILNLLLAQGYQITPIKL